jgi:putative oxidoreductase
MSLESTVKRTREKLLAITRKLSFLPPALIRLTIGLVFIPNGWGKLHNLPEITEYFASLHIPLPALNVRIAASTELFGGLLILVGLGARLAAVPLAFTMLIALISAKHEEITGLATLVGQEEWSYLVMCLTIAIIGPGALSLDSLVARWFGRTGNKPLPKPVLSPGQATTTQATTTVDG